MAEKLLLINVAGGAHGSQEFARSPIHDSITDYLRSRIDVKDIFVPSTDVKRDPATQKVSGVQLPPSYQRTLIREAVNEASMDERIPMAVAHSFGSIATMASLRDGTLPYAIFVSPIFLNPREEIFGSPKVSQRMRVVELASGEVQIIMEPDKMYPVIFPNDHLDDPLYRDNIVSKPEAIQEISDLLAARARIFIGEYDWNSQSYQYPLLFLTEVVEKETHSFEQNEASIAKVSNAILQLIGKV